jgi:hypothetical protein
MPKSRQRGLPDSSALAADDWQQLTASDTVPLDPLPRAIMITAAGNVTVKGKSGNSMALTAVPANTILDISPTLLMATGTSATVFGLY